jgi:hypothetical protein
LIAEIIPGFYDFDGKRISQPSKKRHPSFKGRPMGSFLTQPLKIVCGDIDSVRAFLKTCRYISDQDQFGVRDHWMSPQQFEQARQGDCEDFALWTCRQLLGLGYNARFGAGCAGRYGSGHAWVSFRDRNGIFLLEPQLARRKTFPRLDTLSYEPVISVEVTGSEVKFFEHAKRAMEPPFRTVAPLVPEWLQFRLRSWLRALARLPVRPFLAVKRR